MATATTMPIDPGREPKHPCEPLADRERTPRLLVEKTGIQGLFVLTPRRFKDERGFFCETYNQESLRDYGIETRFVQDNHSVSERVGTVRGLHFQSPPNAQAKLVRCGRGALFDVAVDIRRGSPTFGHWFGVELSSENGKQLLVPEGFAHGFVTRQPMTEIIYKCSRPYAPEAGGAIRYDDPDLAIEWAFDGREPVLSEKDKSAPFLKNIISPFHYEDLT